MLFGRLNDNIFQLLVGPAKGLYAALLPRLADGIFAISGQLPRRDELLDEIERILGRFANEVQDDRGLSALSIVERRAYVLRALVEAGWLVEHKDRFQRSYDFHPDARILIDALSSIETPDAMSYGGTILDVLGALESASTFPDMRSESVRNAYRAAHNFEKSLRQLAGVLRFAQARIVGASGALDTFKSWFDDFVEKHLVSDFKTLRTKQSPFRFRLHVARLALSMAINEPLVEQLSSAWVKEGRSDTLEQARAEIRRHLFDVSNIAERAELHIKALDDIIETVESRVSHSLKFAERVTTGQAAMIRDLIKSLAATPALMSDKIVDSILLPRSFPYGPAHISLPQKVRRPIAPTLIEQREPDPRVQLWMDARARYVREVAVSEERLTDFIERHLGQQTKIKGSDILIDNVADFVLFQRLREIPFLWGGRLARRYHLSLDTTARVDNGWLKCRDFSITRSSAEVSA